MSTTTSPAESKRMKPRFLRSILASSLFFLLSVAAFLITAVAWGGLIFICLAITG